MAIVALPENFHYPILHNAKINVSKKKEKLQCEANKSLADKKAPGWTQ